MDLVCIEIRQMTEIFQVTSVWQTEFEKVLWVLGKNVAENVHRRLQLRRLKLLKCQEIQVIFRRERSDDRKYVCASQVK